LFLGRNYSITGKVVHGRKLGKSIGFPTANINVEDETKLIPCNGIYAVRVEHQGVFYHGMLSIGNNPTIENAKWSIEINIFDFDRDIYGDDITVYFISHMRDEVKFNSMDDLITQLKKDETEARAIVSKYEID